MNMDTREILNLFLYGTLETPDDLLNNKLTSRNAFPTYEIDALDFMTTGAGRFATGSQSNLVQAFFDSGNQINPGAYSKAQLAAYFGLSYYGVTYQAYDYNDNINDYGERTLIYNTQAFKLGDDVQFIVAADGTRHINNYSIIPDAGIQENFDFDSNNPVAVIGNIILESLIDPSSIGLTVNINFSTLNVSSTTYDISNYLQEQSLVSIWKSQAPSWSQLADGVLDVADDAFEQGLTSFLYDDQPILYGSSGDDLIRASDAENNPNWQDYLINGVVIVGGIGDDIAYGSGFGDLFIGGGGSDTYYGGGGRDVVSYRSSDQGVVIDLDQPSSNSGDAANDTYSGIEAFEGSREADMFTGSRGNFDFFDGLEGNDYIVLNDRQDTVTGGAGADIFALNALFRHTDVRFDDFEQGFDSIFAQLNLSFSVINDFNPAEGDKLDISDYNISEAAHLDQPPYYTGPINNELLLLSITGDSAVIVLATGVLLEYYEDDLDRWDFIYTGVTLENFNAENFTYDMFVI